MVELEALATGSERTTTTEDDPLETLPGMKARPRQFNYSHTDIIIVVYSETRDDLSTYLR